MGSFISTDWKYDTSKAEDFSFLLGVGFGEMWFSNTKTGEKLTLKYREVSIEMGPIGPPLPEYSWSHTSDPSTAHGHVGVVLGKYFGPLSFPCHGYILNLSATLGFDAFGNRGTHGATEILFGLAPAFAGLRITGSGHAALPGAGAGGGVALFEIA